MYTNESKRIITMTHEQANLLTCYILMTTQHRRGELEAWESLAKERNDDGTPKFPNAGKNAEFYRDLEGSLENIKRIIENAPWEEEQTA